MGDRANLVIREKALPEGATLKEALEGSVVLYTHHGGSELGEDTARALVAAKSRWDDAPYCTRIIVSQIVGDDFASTTGHGLSVGKINDNERPILVLAIDSQMVYRFPYGDDESQKASASWSFMDFAGMSPARATKSYLID